MRSEEIVRLWAGRIFESAKELCEDANYRDKLCRLKEMTVFLRELQVSLDRLETKIAVDFHKQTGLRAAAGIWKRLSVKQKDD